MKQLYTVKEITDILKSYGYKFDEKENIKGGISLWFTGSEPSWNKLKNDANQLDLTYFNVGGSATIESIYGDGIEIEKQRNGVFVRISKTKLDKRRRNLGVDYDYDMNEVNQKLENLIENIIRKVLLEKVTDSDLYNLNADKIKDYNYTIGENVTVKHKSWKEPRVMQVIKPGKYPDLQLGALVIELRSYNINDFIIIPEKLRGELQQPEKGKRANYAREKRLTKREYFKNLKDMIRGLEHEDHSYFWDQAENIYTSQPDMVDYVKKIYGIWRKNDVIEQLTNDMEIYAK